MNYQIVAERMRKIKEENGICFSHIEEVTGLSSARIDRLLSGKSMPSLLEFALLCEALGASSDELFRTNEKWEADKK